MKRLIALLLLSSCSNKIDVPTTIEACFRDPVTKQCTNQAVVKHIITVELPAVLTDSCKATWNEHDFPDKAIREAGYNSCVTDYINSLLKLIKGISPADLPTGL